MKKACLILAACLLTFVLAEARTVKKVYDIDDFTGISASHAFQVTLEKAKTFSVEIEISEEFLPYLVVMNRNGSLELGFATLPLKLRQKERNKVAKAVVRMPVLTAVYLSGASSLTVQDPFSNAMNKFSLTLKGGSSVRDLTMKAPETEIELSGASQAVLRLQSSKVDVELSGASRVELSGKTTELEASLSGASRLAGASFEAEKIELEAKGASNADVRPLRSLEVKLSGASRCRYYGNAEKLKVDAAKIKGASSLTHQEESIQK